MSVRPCICRYFCFVFFSTTILRRLSRNACRVGQQCSEKMRRALTRAMKMSDESCRSTAHRIHYINWNFDVTRVQGACVRDCSNAAPLPPNNLFAAVFSHENKNFIRKSAGHEPLPLLCERKINYRRINCLSRFWGSSVLLKGLAPIQIPASTWFDLCERRAPCTFI